MYTPLLSGCFYKSPHKDKKIISQQTKKRKITKKYMNILLTNNPDCIIVLID